MFEGMKDKRDNRDSTAPRRGPRFVRRRSSIHGYGIFAARSIPSGTRLVEYKGALIDSKQAEGRYPEIDTPPHTFLFDAEDDLYIDAGVNGNSARWINHSCDPNCESVQEGRRVFIESIRAIRPGEELTYDYRIMLDGPHDSAAKRQWVCRCGAKNCRGTMLASKR
jgi:SET domain-containing protein